MHSFSSRMPYVKSLKASTMSQTSQHGMLPVNALSRACHLIDRLKLVAEPVIVEAHHEAVSAGRLT